MSIKVGRKLPQGEVSRSGLYGILSKDKDRLLRVSLMQETAEFLCDYESRYLAECFIE